MGMKFNRNQKHGTSTIICNCTFYYFVNIALPEKLNSLRFTAPVTRQREQMFQGRAIEQTIYCIRLDLNKHFSVSCTYKCAIEYCMLTMLRRRYMRSPQVFFPWFEDSKLRRWSRASPIFRASTRPQHVGPNNKNKHPGVELVPQCEDLNEEHVELPRHTVRGNPIPHSLSFSPFLLPSPLSPILSCSLSFASLSTFYVA